MHISIEWQLVTTESSLTIRCAGANPRCQQPIGIISQFSNAVGFNCWFVPKYIRK